ncbi:HU family DNA-binding protein [Acetilactobacillus jinshanensis]|uniref:DNA-binding protein HU n=1 Tax=Acetilactobacillus jinshanensis TaxID=1720083 RepID=A0A4P6ZL25_9LACO|nr:HU family DNA-binding protein [Acetilactobacillus jinshanensis]QBP18525.1 HU family DNA-binding protein [Acetilactobacillus jinshanensis]URL61398.1 HU family DNA-binding protein [uncultured bacterium]
MVNKSELLSSMVKKTGLTKKDATKALDAFVATVKDSLAKGQGIRLIGFGSFTVRHRAARKGRNPQTGKAIKISARNVPAFKAGKGLKDNVNK